jgi:iron-sulfur cluster repair protein YtfE (RIC family)
MHTTDSAPIHGGMTVNQIVQRAPHALPILAAAGIDACCGGGLPLEEAARRHGAEPAALLAAIAAAAPA